MNIARLAAAVAIAFSSAVLAETPQELATQPDAPAALLLPAVQKVREAAARIGDGVAPHERLGLTPIDPAPRGGVRIAVGDVNGDGAATHGRPSETLSLNYEEIKSRGANEMITVGSQRTESASDVTMKGSKVMQNFAAPTQPAGHIPQGILTPRKGGGEGAIPTRTPSSAPRATPFDPIHITKKTDVAVPARAAPVASAPVGTPAPARR